LAFIPVCCDRIAYRKEGVNASVAMEHMIPDLLISEKVRYLVNVGECSE